MGLGITEHLASLVRKQFAFAQASAGALTFAATELAIVRFSTIPLQLRYCPALAKKPKPAEDSSAGLKKKIDPFESPDPALFISNVPLHDFSHLLVLNKYPIIPHHFILATKENKPQNHFLETDDLWLTYQCLREWEKPREDGSSAGRLFAFFNSGSHSGASQPHRHVQMLPIEDMKFDVQGNEWDLLIDKIVDDSMLSKPEDILDLSRNTSLPFKIFGSTLPLEPTSASLLKVYRELYKMSTSAAEEYLKVHPGNFQPDATERGALEISYNLAMTTRSMVMCPRRREGMVVRRDDGSEIDQVALNGTVLGGTMMVKNEELFQLLRDDNKRLVAALEAGGIPSGESTRSSAERL